LLLDRIVDLRIDITFHFLVKSNAIAELVELPPKERGRELERERGRETERERSYIRYN